MAELISPYGGRLVDLQNDLLAVMRVEEAYPWSPSVWGELKVRDPLARRGPLFARGVGAA